MFNRQPLTWNSNTHITGDSALNIVLSCANFFFLCFYCVPFARRIREQTCNTIFHIISCSHNMNTRNHLTLMFSHKTPILIQSHTARLSFAFSSYRGVKENSNIERGRNSNKQLHSDGTQFAPLSRVASNSVSSDANNF